MADMWDESNVDDEGPPPKSKVWLVLVVAGLLVLTLVLCCVVAGQLGQMFQLRLPPL